MKWVMKCLADKSIPCLALFYFPARSRWNLVNARSCSFKMGCLDETPCVFVCVPCCVRGILCGLTAQCQINTLALVSTNTHTDTQTNTEADWVAEERPDDRGPFNDDVTVVKTASLSGLDSQHANQLAWERGESATVYSTDGLITMCIRLEKEVKLSGANWQQLWKLFGFQCNEIKCSVSGLSYSSTLAAK